MLQAVTLRDTLTWHIDSQFEYTLDHLQEDCVFFGLFDYVKIPKHNIWSNSISFIIYSKK